MELRRVLLKLSGEALAGDKKTGFDEPTVTAVAAAYINPNIAPANVPS